MIQLLIRNFTIFAAIIFTGNYALANNSCKFELAGSAATSRLESILSAPAQDNFAGPSGTYGRTMASAIIEFSPTVGGFDHALQYFVSKRLEVIKNDLASATTAAEQKLFEEQLSYMDPNSDSPLNKRLAGVGQHRIETSVRENSGRYKEFYKMIKQTGIGFPNGKMAWQRWSPTAPSEGPDLQSAPLEIVHDGIYWVKHARNEDVPAIIDHLRLLWDGVIESKNEQRTNELIAKFEWWFIVGNPTARGAASLGNILSLSLQIKKDLRLRKEFIHLDWYALSRSVDEYVQWRKEI